MNSINVEYKYIRLICTATNRDCRAHIKAIAEKRARSYLVRLVHPVDAAARMHALRSFAVKSRGHMRDGAVSVTLVVFD